jgi:hypothetical protein
MKAPCLPTYAISFVWLRNALPLMAKGLYGYSVSSCMLGYCCLLCDKEASAHLSLYG